MNQEQGQIVNSVGGAVLSSGETVNRFIPKSEKYGIDLNTLKIDAKTGLPVETPELRNVFVKQVSECVRSSKHFAYFTSDLNGLKKANSTGRWLGDKGITWNGFISVNGLLSVVDGSRTTMLPYREGDAADEIGVWMFDINEEDLRKINGVVEDLNAAQTENSTILFSVSAALTSSLDPEIEHTLPLEKSWLDVDENKVAHRVFNRMKDMTDKKVTEIKDAKSLDKFNKIVSREDLSDDLKIQKIRSEFCDIRLSSVLFDRVIDFCVSAGKKTAPQASSSQSSG